jgi:hypothetical protein
VTGTRPGQPPPDLTARLFQALYPDCDLRTISGTHIVTPKGTPALAGASLGQIAFQLSTCHQADRVHPSAVSPATLDQGS